MKSKSDGLNFSIFQWIIISIRTSILAGAIGFNCIAQKFIILISTLFPFQIWKRYLSCIINLIMTRIALLALGYFKIQTQNFQYFSRTQQKLLLKSGSIGIGTHKNIIDFFYYSYIFNPMFVKIILIVDKIQRNGQQIEYIKDVNYSPLTYQQALQSAIKNRGFDPIIVRNQKQLKKLKCRKMAMKTLVSQSFQQLKGAIFILLPGLKPGQHVQIQEKIMHDVFDNQIKFLRSGVGLKIKLDQRQIIERKYKNQVHFILNIMSELKINKMLVDSITSRNFKSYYTKQTYRNYIQQNFFLFNNGRNTTHKKISYIEYIDQLNKQEGIIQDKKSQKIQQKQLNDDKNE